ncbi:MAG TPA: hypothetical protein VL943_12070 [Niabella sp.]|nr:hypothetical protein [Niabella sp.]
MYLSQLIGFMVKVSTDHRIGPQHIALYLALFQQWCINNGENPVSAFRIRLQEVAKISRTTYHKCMRDLEQFGYIRYIRSSSPVLESIVYLEEMKSD